ncbi:methyltransferase [Streptomyces sp. SID3343]|uniref:methyltransferase n=1 Tax=Streptomyces sp. SID3343 TaxID=2690260 RepID=UPI00136D412F|nr:methyltransferase [Streptomyces sp. SID3343]MYV99972.1 hydroxyneurosporene methyltransferase [Streptomyces sp. SID3343]
MPEALERAIFGMHATHAVHLADRHGVFAFLIAHGASRTGKIAAGTGTDAETVGRLLVALRAFGVLEGDDGEYRVPEASIAYLDPSASRYAGAFVRHLVGSTSARMPQLDAYLSHGKARVDDKLPDPFDVMYADDAAVEAFVSAMWQLSFDVSGELVELAGPAMAGHLVDVGGANGPFSVAALLRVPDLRATVFDLPHVAPHLHRAREAYRLGERLAFAPGDFFRDELPEGDCVAFGYVLSDWDDDACLALLRKARRACRSGGRVLVMDRLFDDDGHRPLATAVMNLSMHVETRGRHRTAAEYVGLLRAAGLTDCEVRRSGREKHLVVGRAPAGGE